MPSACIPGAPPLPTAYELATRNPLDMTPLDKFMTMFEPNVIDSPIHEKFRPMLQEALEYYAANRDKLAFEAVRAKIHDEHASGLDG